MRERRDFTMNALSVGADGVVHDYVGGLADLAARRVRFIGDARRRIEEDYLRILRFFRFHAAYGQGAPDAAGLAACIAARAGLEQLVARTGADGIAQASAGAARDAGARGDGGVPACWCRCWAAFPISASFENMAKVEAAAGVQADAVQRLGALGARIAEDAERLWQRLRLSNAEHERLASMAEAWWRISAASATRTAARCSIGSGRERFHRSRAARLGALAGDRPRSGLARPGDACRSAGPRRCFR